MILFVMYDKTLYYTYMLLYKFTVLTYYYLFLGHYISLGECTKRSIQILTHCFTVFLRHFSSGAGIGTFYRELIRLLFTLY